jgi:hypothetical protein
VSIIQTFITKCPLCEDTFTGDSPAMATAALAIHFAEMCDDYREHDWAIIPENASFVIEIERSVA